MRHIFTTHALASGVDVKTLSGILDHTRAAFTLDTYTHTTGDMQRRAAEEIDQSFGKVEAPTAPQVTASRTTTSFKAQRGKHRY